MRPEQSSYDPLLSHPLANVNATAEREQRTAYAAQSTPTPPVLPPSPPPARAQRPPLPASNPVPFVARRAPPQTPPRIVGANDPLSGALRTQPSGQTERTTAYAHTAIATDSDISTDAVAAPLPLPLPHEADAGAAVSVRPARDTSATVISGVFVVHARGMDAQVPPSPTSSSVASSTPDDETRICVSRNIADFVWLEQRLRARYDSVIVPHLPPMALRGRLLHGFAYEAERVRGLERFLAHVVAHPVLARVEETVAFLGAAGPRAWMAARSRPLQRPPAPLIDAPNEMQNAPLSAFRRWGAFKVWQAGRRVNKALVWFLNRDSQETERLSAQEKQLQRLHTYVKQLQNSLHDTRMAARAIADARRHDAARAAQLQSALHQLGDSEGGAFGALLRAIHLVDAPPPPPPVAIADARSENEEDAQSTESSATVEVGTTVDAVTAPEVALEEMLRDYEVRAIDAQRLVKLRGGEREAYEHAVEIYAKLRARWELSTSSIWDGAQDDVARPAAGEALYAEIVAAADTLAEAQRQYQRVDRSTNDELRRLRTQLHDELLVALRDVAKDRADAHAALRDAWLTTAAAVDAHNDPDPADMPRAPTVPVDS